MSDLKLLHAKIGQLMLENDFLESALNGILPDGSATSEGACADAPGRRIASAPPFASNRMLSRMLKREGSLPG